MLLLDGWSGFLARTEAIIEWCIQNNIPIRTYAEWADILYEKTPNPDENIFPPLNVDLDRNNFPDGYNRITNAFIEQADGAPVTENFSLVTSKLGTICKIENLGGIEKGQNEFEIWTKGSTGNFIEVIFKVGEQDIKYKFPAESSYWQKYTLKESLTENKNIIIPENVSLIDVTINCSNYYSGEVKISGMTFSKPMLSNNSLMIAPSTKSVEPSSGNTSFSILSNVSWTASVNENWVSLSPSSGSNNGSFNASFTENTSSSSRTATITIAGAGISRSATITQAAKSSSGGGDYLNVPETLNISNASGGTSIDVSSNVSWVVSDNTSKPDWLNKAPKTGTGNGQVQVSWLENTTGAARTGQLIWKSGSITKIMTITQGGGSSTTNFLTVTSSSQSIAFSSGNTSFSISSNVSWTASVNENWVSLSPPSGSNNGSLNASFTENTSSSSRTATITIAGAGISRSATITQAAKSSSGGGDYLNVPETLNISNASGGTSIDVSSNVSWVVSDNTSKPDWLNKAPKTGTGNGQVQVSWLENTTGAARTGQLIWKSGSITKIMTITQGGGSSTTNFLTVTSSSQSIAFSSGNTSFSISSNVSWTASVNENWVSLSPPSGSNNGSLNASFTENTSSSSRTATITIAGAGISRSATITQAGFVNNGSSNYINVPEVINLSLSSGTIIVDVQSNTSWRVTDNTGTPGWISKTPKTGTGDGQVTVTYGQNNSQFSREGQLIFVGGGITKSINLIQSGNSNQLSKLALDENKMFLDKIQESVSDKPNEYSLAQNYLTSGIYIYSLKVNAVNGENFIQNKKMILAK